MKVLNITLFAVVCTWGISLNSSAFADTNSAIPSADTSSFVQYVPPVGDWGTAVDGLQLRATTPMPSYAVSERIIIDIDARYTAGKSLLSETYGTEQEFAVEATDSLGHSVQKTAYGVTIPQVNGLPGAVFRNHPVILSNNQVAEWHFWINRMFDMTNPGVYQVKFTRYFKNANGSESKASSNTLQIKVMATGSPTDVNLVSPTIKTAQ